MGCLELVGNHLRLSVFHLRFISLSFKTDLAFDRFYWWSGSIDFYRTGEGAPYREECRVLWVQNGLSLWVEVYFALPFQHAVFVMPKVQYRLPRYVIPLRSCYRTLTIFNWLLWTTPPFWPVIWLLHVDPSLTQSIFIQTWLGPTWEAFSRWLVITFLTIFMALVHLALSVWNVVNLIVSNVSLMGIWPAGDHRGNTNFATFQTLRAN